MLIIFGLIATYLFLSGLITQIIKIHRRKIADDLSSLTLIKWCVGLIIFLIISLQTNTHWIFPFGYAAQVITCFYLFLQVLHYQKEMNIKMKHIQKNIKKGVNKHLRIHDGGKK